MDLLSAAPEAPADYIGIQTVGEPSSTIIPLPTRFPLGPFAVSSPELTGVRTTFEDWAYSNFPKVAFSTIRRDIVQNEIIFPNDF